MSNDSSKGYKFTIVNSVITAVYEFKNGRTKFEKMDSNETWSVDGANIVKTEWDHGRMGTTTYSDPDGDGIFAKVMHSFGAISSSVAPLIATPQISNGYQFDLVNGTVVSVYEIEHGASQQVRIDLNETWTVDGSNIIKTEVERGLTETTTYVDANGDGIFSKISKVYTADNGVIWSGTSGSDNDDLWKGSVGDDHYFAGNGNDSVIAGAGNDEIFGADGNDRIAAGAGADSLYGGNGDDVLSGGDGVDHLEGGIGNDVLDGGIGDDYLTGGAGVDVLTGSTGNDDLYGEDGNDILSGGDGIDHLDGGLGNDAIGGGTGNDYLSGGAGVDALTGDVGNDALYGGDGNDVLSGGAGSDELYGGFGNDTFKFTNIYESGLTATTRDHVFDFAAGDKIDLSSIDAISGNRTNDAFNFVGTAADVTAANANGAVWFQNGIVYGSNDRDTVAEFQIELVGVNELNATYFIL